MNAQPHAQASWVSVAEWLQSGRTNLDEPKRHLMTKVKKQYWPLLAAILKEVYFEAAGSSNFELQSKLIP